ncbi:hypothetical protein BvCmsNSNP027_00179 [Escherichia coli]|nr:hypothetical protein BvCmsNSNP027_00179 [Escherichia coli]
MVSTGSQFVSHRLSIVCMDNRMPLQRQTPVFLGKFTGYISGAIHDQYSALPNFNHISYIHVSF